MKPRDARMCCACRQELEASDFPEVQIASYCSHGPHTCIYCIKESIVRMLDEGLPEIISCPQCGVVMLDEDIWRFTDQTTYQR